MIKKANLLLKEQIGLIRGIFMKMDLVLELMDVPGQLVSVLDPISGLGANLVTVIHKRDSKNEKG